MDLLDEMLNHSPKEKFLQMLKHANSGAVERVMENFIKEHIALNELLESKGVDEEEIELYKMEKDYLLEERMNDYFIELTAKILGHGE
ncbi:DUF2018 family protein [Campylobacter troglodytis]|uniref:DUF2018 family protein n=1 Tax=Campylobacter troglodytis TaxID=654363 RepID=UPI0011591BA8|nr:DUF2018 family protein [Campylobacter troglodytis]TQR60556.1 DUF2018 domain-containing protein [Campylobacter troglodytis]